MNHEEKCCKRNTHSLSALVINLAGSEVDMAEFVVLDPNSLVNHSQSPGCVYFY
jgi:hypothetical protein